jgi:hypothetical protein
MVRGELWQEEIRITLAFSEAAAFILLHTFVAVTRSFVMFIINELHFSRHKHVDLVVFLALRCEGVECECPAVNSYDVPSVRQCTHSVHDVGPCTKWVDPRPNSVA